MKRVEIREYANKIRNLLGYKSTDFIHAPKLFDRLAIILSENGLDFDYRVMPDDDKVFYEKEEAWTDLLSGTIYIKESVMEQACRRSFRRGPFTLIHELGHYLIHYVQGDVKLTRVSDDVNVPIYQDPECQAYTFASEFLMPFCECLKIDSLTIRKRYHVSTQASEVRYEKIQKEIKTR